MSDFVWNNGGNYGKTWGEHLPNDASVSHLKLYLLVSFEVLFFKESYAKPNCM